MKIRYNLDNVQYAEKPDKPTIAKIVTRLKKESQIVETDPEDLISAIEHGQTFTTGVLKGTKAETWQSQQIFVVDIDNERKDKTRVDNPLLPQDAYEMLLCADIIPYCMYHTFSSKADWPRFRVMIISDQATTNSNETKMITRKLSEMFNTNDTYADSGIHNLDRLIFGTRPNSIIIHDKAITHLSDLQDLASTPEQQTTQIDIQKSNSLPAFSDKSDEIDLRDALKHITKADYFSYYNWLHIGMALKTEGYSVEDWIDWSRGAGEDFDEKECRYKWEGFSNSGEYRAGTIIYFAEIEGWENPCKRNRQKKHAPLKWDAYINEEDSGYIHTKADYEDFSNSTEADTPATEPTPLDHFEDFLNEIQSERFRPISTGLDQLDSALCGGFERKTLVTLASAPGVGKTAISQYILENMSANGHSVIYVNLEMDRSQLLSRSISRLSHEYSTLNPYSEDMTAIQVRRGYAWTDSQKKIVKEMSDIYRERIAPRFTYITTNKENTGAIDNGLKSILEKITKLTEESVKTTGEAPLICIDYLQFIEYDLLREGQKKPDTAESIKMTLNALKQFAMKYNTVILVITANNRASNAEGRASMDSGRDTSNIEYSGDVMLSMVYTAVEEGWLHKNGKKDKYGNDKYTRFDNDYINRLNDYSDKNKGNVSAASKLLSLKVVKGRSIKPRGTAKFVYDGAYYYFREDVSDSQRIRSFYQPEGIDTNCIDGDASPMLLDQ